MTTSAQNAAKSAIATLLADNSNGEISAADIRSVLTQIVEVYQDYARADNLADMATATNEIALLDVTGKLTSSQIPDSILSALEWKGVWNATTNSPAIPTAASGNNGYFYRVSVAGTSSITGSSVSFSVGDWLISNGTAWERVANTQSDATTASKGIVQLAGDLAGTATAPSVDKIKGVAISGTPTAGKALIATSADEASWQATSGPAPAIGDEERSLKGDGTYKHSGTPRSFSNTYRAGDIVDWWGITVVANDDIPANTAFSWGTAGATWSPLFAKGSTHLWRGIYSDGSTYAVNDVVAAGSSTRVYICVTAVTTAGAAFEPASGTSKHHWVAFINAGGYFFKGAGSTLNGQTGLVPTPMQGDENKLLRGDGTWATVINDQTSSRYVDIGGLRIQWGRSFSGLSGVRTVVMPQPFATDTYSLTVTADNGQGAPLQSSRAAIVGNKSTTQFEAYIATGTDTPSTINFSWQAMGVKPT